MQNLFDMSRLDPSDPCIIAALDFLSQLSALPLPSQDPPQEVAEDDPDYNEFFGIIERGVSTVTIMMPKGVNPHEYLNKIKIGMLRWVYDTPLDTKEYCDAIMAIELS